MSTLVSTVSRMNAIGAVLRRFTGKVKMSLKIHGIAVLASVVLFNLAYANTEPNSLPELYFSSDQFAVNEGDSIRFEISSTFPAAEDLNVEIKIRNLEGKENEIVGQTRRTTVLPAGETSTSFEIQTTQNTFVNKSKTITVHIYPGEGYTSTKNKFRTRFRILDDDGSLPQAIIYPFPPYTSTTIKAGDNIQYRIHVNPAPTEDVTFNLDVVTTLDQEQEDQPPSSVTFKPEDLVESGGTSFFPLEISSKGEFENHEEDGFISIELKPGEGYIPKNNFSNIVSIESQESQARREVRLYSTTKSGIVEGEVATFELFTGHNVYRFPINVAVSSSGGDFVLGGSVMKVYSNPTRQYSYFQVMTEDDSVDEPDGSITVRLLPGDDYELRTRTTATVAVYDNDDSPVPEVSIAANSSESMQNLTGNAQFLLSFSEPPARSISIGYTKVIESGGTQLASVSETVDVSDLHITRQSGGEYKALMNVAIGNGTVTESGGVIKLTLASDTTLPNSYTVNSESNSATKQILPNIDFPYISVTARDDEVEEGDRIYFNLESRSYPGLWSQLMVNVKVENIHGNFLQHEMTKQVRFTWEDYDHNWAPTGRFSVRTVDNDLVEADGLVRATVLPGEGYGVADRPFGAKPDGTADTVVKNNDSGPAEVSFAVSSLTVKKHEIADVFMTSTSPSYTDVRMKFDCTTFEGWGVEWTRTLRAGGPAGSVSLSEPFHVYSWSPSHGCSPTHMDGASFAIKILPSPNGSYSIAEGGISTIEILVDSDRTVQFPEISIAAGKNFVDETITKIVEGGNLEFVLSTDYELGKDLEINLNFEDSGGFLEDSTPTQVVMAARRREQVVVIPTVSNGIVNADTDIKAIIQPGDGYAVAGSPDNSATITVMDDDELPVISFEGKRYNWFNEKNGYVHFLITSSIDLDSELTVLLNVSETENMLSSPIGRHQVLMDSKRELFRLQLDDDSLVEPHSVVSVEILESDSYRLNSNSSTYETVGDDDKPEVSIAAVEGSKGEFELRLDQPYDKPLTWNGFWVNISLSSGRAIECGFPYYCKIKFESGESTKRFKVVFGDEHQMTATVVEGSEYVVAAAPDNAAEITLTEPIISIFSNADNEEDRISTDEQISFTLVSSKLLTSDLTVKFRTNFYGIYGEENESVREITMKRGKEEYLLSITPDESGLSEVMKGVWVILIEAAGYHVSDDDIAVAEYNSTLSISLVDGTKDEFEVKTEDLRSSIVRAKIDLANETETRRIHLSFSRRESKRRFKMPAGFTTATIQSDSDYFYFVAQPPNNSAAIIQPRISIDAVASPVAESGMAQFTVTSSETVEEALTVNLNVEVDHRADIVISPIGDHSVTIAADTNEAVLTLVLDDDEIYEQDDVVTARVVAGAGYVLATGDDGSATIRVTDDDVRPVASIAKGGALITEGEEAEFTVTLDKPAGMDFHVVVGFNDGEHDFLADWDDRTERPNAALDESTGVINNAYRLALPFSRGESSYTVSIPTLDDDTVEDEGTITARIAGRDRYTVAPAPDDRASVTVLDNDVAPPPELEIAANSPTVAEGGTVTFTITSTPAPTNSLSVEVSIATLINGNEHTSMRTIVIPADETAESFTVEATDDDLHGTSGSVTATMVANSGFQSDETGIRSVVEIQDNDAVPEISIETITETTTEGGTLWFLISADRVSVAHKTINVAVRESTGGFLANDVASGVELWANYRRVHLMVKTVDDKVDESNGVVTVELALDGGYTINSESSVAKASVLDDDAAVPEISIASVGSPVEEGNSAEFQLSADSGSVTGITVNVRVLQQGDYITSSDIGDKTVEISSGSGSLSIPTVDDDLDESNGLVSVEIISGDGYAVAAAPDNVGNVTVTDNDDPPEDPIVSISAITKGVTEGDFAKFEITTQAAVNSDLNVSLVANYDNGQSLSIPEGSTTIKSGEDSAILLVATIDDELYGSDRTLKVSLLVEDGYQVDSQDYFAELTVRDNEPIPEISVEAITNSVTEGMPVWFLVSSSEAFATAQEIGISVSQGGGDFLKSPAPASVSIQPYHRIVFVSLMTDDDDVVEADGTIALELVEGLNYATDLSKGMDSVTIKDNDVDLVIPELSVVGVLPSFEEGWPAFFLINSDVAPSSNLPIRVSVTQTGDFMLGPVPTTVNMPHDWGFAVFSVNTDDDDEEEDDGTIRVEILSGDGYSVVAPSNVAEVVIRDNDEGTQIPEVSIYETESRIVEGGLAQFILSLSDRTVQSLTVNLSVNLAGDFFGSMESGPITHVFRNGDAFKVHTLDDEIQEADGSVRLELLPDTPVSGENPAYRLGTESVASVTVTDNDENTEISIIAGISPVVEGETASFSLISTKTLGQDIKVNVGIEETSNVISGTVSESVTIVAGRNSAILQIATLDDTNNETGSRILVALQAGTGYQVAASPDDSAFLDVTDNDQIRLQVRISPEGDYPDTEPWNGNWTEGLPALVQFVTVPENTTSDRDLTINIAVGDTLGKLAGTSPSSVVLPAGTDRTELRLPTICNQIGESESELAVEIQTGHGYVIEPGKGRSIAKIPDVDISSVDQTGCPGMNVVAITAEGSSVVAGDDAMFTITGNTMRGHVQSVNVQIANLTGNFLIQPEIRSVQIPGGSYGTTFAVATLADGGNENGMIVASIGTGDGYEAGFPNIARMGIEVNESAPNPSRSEVLHRNVLPELLDTGIEQSNDTLASRIDFAFDSPAQRRFELGGAGTVEDMVTRSGELLNEDKVDWGTFMNGSSFSIPLTSDSIANTATLWGSGFKADVADNLNGDSIDWRGELLNGHLGFDARIGTSLLAGIVASSSSGSVEFTLDEGDDEVEGLYRVQVTSMQPYLAWSSEDLGTRLHGSVGYGLGEVEIDYDDEAAEVADINQFSAMLGGREQLYSSDSLFGSGQGELTLRAEGWMARQRVKANEGIVAGAVVESGSMKIATEASAEWNLKSGASINPVASIGTRWDSGINGSGLGLEMAGGTKYGSLFGVDISGSGQFLVSDGYAARPGLKGEILYDSHRDGIGIVSSISPAWGEVDQTGDLQIWNEDLADDNRDYFDDSEKFKVESKIGYGFAVRDGTTVVTPFVHSNMIEGNMTNFGIGSKIDMGLGNEFELEATNETRSNGDLNRSVRLKSNFNW